MLAQTFLPPLKTLLLACFSLLLVACGQVSVKPSSRDAELSGGIDINRIPNTASKSKLKNRYNNPESYVVLGKRYYVMKSSKGFSETGIASWYGKKFHGRRTSSGETYNMYAMTAAHKSLPLPTYAKVTNLKNGKSVIVKVNDRGPFHSNRIIDLSYAAALKLDIVRDGTGLVEISIVDSGKTVDSKSAGAAPVITVATNNNTSHGVYIQIGSFSELFNAEKMRARLGPIGEALAEISQVVILGNTLYRVRIGPLIDISKANEIVSSLENYGIHEHRIVLE